MFKKVINGLRNVSVEDSFPNMHIDIADSTMI